MQKKTETKAKFPKAPWAALALTLASCTTSPVVVEPSPSPSAVATSSPTPAPTISLSVITSIAANSACAKYSWKDRGKAPLGYVKGVALSFSRSVCNQWPVMTKSLGDSDHDALKLYGKEASLVNTYTLLLGLGMRESSGKYYEGRDMSASNTSSDTAEAGAWQASWNSHSASSELVALFNQYRAHPETCLLDVFKEDVGDHMTSNYGSGEGLAFQKLSKECPAFAAQYTATLIRILRRHFGPFSSKSAEFRDECALMFHQVEEATVCK